MPDLEEKLYRWIGLNVEVGIIQSPGMQADAYAQAERNKGNDYAEAYERNYRELYDEQMRGLMQAQGLIPCSELEELERELPQAVLRGDVLRLR